MLPQLHSQPLPCSAAPPPPQLADAFWPRSPISGPAPLPGVGNPGVLHRLDVAAAANITVKNESEGCNNLSLLHFSASIKITYGRQAKVTNEATSHKCIGTNKVTPCLFWHRFISKLLTPHSKVHNPHFISFLYKRAFAYKHGISRVCIFADRSIAPRVKELQHHCSLFVCHILCQDALLS